MGKAGVNKVSPRKSLPTVISRLNAQYPDATYELNWDTPLELLVGTILAAQCTDERVNRVTRSLFKKYPDAVAYAAADLSELEEDVKPTGFYRNKARAIQVACQTLVDEFDGRVPPNMPDMLRLPRVARKTANVVLNIAFQLPTGIIVDSHVARVVQRMELVKSTKADQIERDLMGIVPKSEWIQFGPAMVLHGRYTCKNSKPLCDACLFEDLCPKLGVPASAPASNTKKKAAKKKATAKSASVPQTRAKLMPKKKQVAKQKAARKAAAVKSTAKRATVKRPKKTVVKQAVKKAAVAGTQAAARKVKPAVKKSSRRAAVKDYGTHIPVRLPGDWYQVLKSELGQSYFQQLERFVAAERKSQTVYPPAADVFNAFRATPFKQVKVLLLGQDPYHGAGQAHGMCFSVQHGVKPPPSLKNMFKELQADLGCAIPDHGNLEAWAAQGVMLLNAVLTVREASPNSHKARGWEQFTDAVIRALNHRSTPVVFLLWGNYAQKKGKLVDTSRHAVIATAHPSPLSAKKFFGSRPYSQVNTALDQWGQSPIDWEIG